ncbi:potassium/proton antiporter [Erysipelotrichaceae bacterium OttesenSCG-928-M19]|nr:potassium/proton antiporter [Erysipelotrichaceae bacterium OttesenSCG-928-M19]
MFIMLLLGISIILIISCFTSKIMFKLGVPTLLIFILIGMFLGYDGPGNIYFDDANLAKNISSFALIFIMFYGGFGLDWKKAKTSVKPASLLATLGVAITAFAIGFFVHWFFKVSLVEGMLLGAVVSSTDAASVFSILNTQKLNLKNNLGYLLEMESGSNDPMSYMLTLIFISLTLGQEVNVISMIVIQITLGVVLGLLIGKIGVKIINKINLEIDGLYSILLIAIAIFSYAFTEYLSGNGFLAVYFTGIILGNSKIVHRFSMIKYFDGLTWLMQIILFFTLGLLVFPSQLPNVALDGIIISVFIIFVARPIAVFSILSFFKYSFKEKLLISWAGFRGAASIVFATFALSYNVAMANWIFNIIFIVALLSVIFQGSLFIPIAKKLNLVEDEELSLTTFYDESGTISADLLEIEIDEESSALNQLIMNLEIPDDILIVMINRKGKVITPKGNVRLLLNDKIILAGKKTTLEELTTGF